MLPYKFNSFDIHILDWSQKKKKSLRDNNDLYLCLPKKALCQSSCELLLFSAFKLLPTSGKDLKVANTYPHYPTIVFSVYKKNCNLTGLLVWL